jgi:hypothetical protein
MTLHGKIMNVQCVAHDANEEYSDRQSAYRAGHRDARHAAAELAIEADALLAELVAALERIDAPYWGDINEARGIARAALSRAKEQQ